MTTRYHVGTVGPASANAAGILDALATLFAVATDVDTGAAVVSLAWTRDMTAGSQAIYSEAFGPRNSRIIIAVHDTGSPASGPPMVASADTYTAANVLIGLCDDAAGAYVNWYAAAPFSGCTFAGYYRLCATAGFASGTIRAWVSTKDLWLQAISTTVHTAHFGAVVTGAVGYQESDGYRYGGMVSGGGVDHLATWRTSASTTAGFARNTSVNGATHAGIYAVGGSTWQTIRTSYIRIVTSATNDMSKWAPGIGARAGIEMQRSTSPEYTVGSWAGVIEGGTALTGAVALTSVGSLWGWYLASTATGPNEDACIIGQTY